MKTYEFEIDGVQFRQTRLPNRERMKATPKLFQVIGRMQGTDAESQAILALSAGLEDVISLMEVFVPRGEVMFSFAPDREEIPLKWTKLASAEDRIFDGETHPMLEYKWLYTVLTKEFGGFLESLIGQRPPTWEEMMEKLSSSPTESLELGPSGDLS